ncbi:thioesterase-like superfamily-domain-containing protein [Ilyonectria robusta]|uniref:thioesterase-like superfamily-domain-containing protein n=1 Tax=Ilyonectria robusta TaxID=1079257 RepID=UPI001E8D4E8B|nr:thioesterase-like superfamily-domain-containing protein [Ilyonectria robusta]KAH8686523.1 thioesterase-like superfamily-domain-containing protein [Ilyonectria robusta]
MTATLSEQVAVEQLGPGEYVSKLCPIRMGNSMPIAYGGCTAAVAVSAACSTIPENLSLYSVLGHFLGPASIDQKLYCSVTNTRDTRSFATRRVQVKQKQPDGQFRVCLELIADFHVQEPSSLTYSAPPESTWPGPEDCPTAQAHAEVLKARGVVTESQYQDFVKSFGVSEKFFETRHCVNGVAGQTLAGASKHTITTQEARHITAKTSAEWQRARESLSSPAQNLGALSFLMDGGLSFLPLTHNHLWFEDVAACSTLDFALRVFTPEVKMDAWHLRERTTSRGGSGRTFSEGKLWDEQGNMVASMSQQSIMRMKKGFELSKL